MWILIKKIEIVCMFEIDVNVILFFVISFLIVFLIGWEDIVFFGYDVGGY